MNKHTPGPWHIGHRGANGTTVIGSIHVAEVSSLNNETEYANARLIAAAPEFLDELFNAAATIGLIIDHLETGKSWSNSMADDLKTELTMIKLKLTKAMGGAE